MQGDNKECLYIQYAIMNYVDFYPAVVARGGGKCLKKDHTGGRGGWSPNFASLPSLNNDQSLTLSSKESFNIDQT